MCKNKGTYCYNDQENAQGYCDYCVRNGYAPSSPKKEPKPIAKESEKRKKLNRIDQKQNRELKKERPMCEIKSPVCTGRAQGTQHVEGRIAGNLTDKSKKIVACNPCNTWVEEHPLEAKAMGVARSKHRTVTKNK